ncbi:AP-5 complex subunit beta-1 [Trichosurus vulpecula]|uniref:AP-5 complex subunit beta-1 n=1 Tax=Trichosurus vulpecula TaxID=9337 RepID=UPI00186B1080|nr:AP-5 complex subunit beta-1 [Trichosurus vulpecula]
MAPRGGDAWARVLASLRASPAAFVARAGAEALAAELLSELRSEKLSEPTKVSLLSVIMEFPTQLWPDPTVAEAAASTLLDTLALLPLRPAALRRPLLLATTSVLASCGALSPASATTSRLLSMLLRVATGRATGREQRALQGTACECLRELESCHPGLLMGQLGLLRALQDTLGTQAHCLLFVLALRNALRVLARTGSGAPMGLQGLLTTRTRPQHGETLAWDWILEAPGAQWPGPWDWTLAGEDIWDRAAPSGQEGDWPEPGVGPLDLTPPEARELRATVSQLLDSSYLLTPPAQAQLLQQLSQVLRAVRGQPPALLKPQLVRLLGTARVSLLHAVLASKDAFGEALFTAQDEALLLRRLVGAAQHPALPPPARLFYLHCLLHFPENWPLGPAGEEGTPVLLTPSLATGLLPSLLQDPPELLARLHLLCLLCGEELGADGNRDCQDMEDQALGYLQGLLAGLRQGAAQPGGPRSSATLCFRASYLATCCLASHPGALAQLTKGLAELYQARPCLAPHFVDLLEQAGEVLSEPLGKALQQVAVAGAGGAQALQWHLQILTKVAGGQPLGPTLGFLWAALGQGGDWAWEQALLGACRALLRGTGHSRAGPQDLANLLQELAQGLDDPDSRDRGRLYYSLFTHLSRPKLGSALGPTRSTPMLCSSLVEENEGFASSLTVQEAQAPLQLRRVPQQAKGPPVVLGLTVEASEILYSLELRFRVLGPHYEPLEAMQVPCLHPGTSPKLLLLPLEPRRPYPALLDISILYATPSGLTCYSQLPSLPIAFADLFLPLQPSSPDRTHPHTFHELWASCLPGGAESCMWGPWRGQALETLVTKHWEPFVMSATPPISYQIAIRLPPSSQLLLQLEAAGEDGVRVALRTDDWAILPLAGEYLRGLGAAA